MFKKYQKIHFVGIGGIGMSGIAEILMTLGLSVTGSDIKRSAITKRLVRRGAKIWIGHDKKYIEGAHVVVISSAVKESNPEVRFAQKQGIPVVPRAEMLAELMRLKYGIAVAGTHGKTTTTTLLAAILGKAGLDPTIIIGGKAKSLRGNARLGRGDFLLAEADESDRSFLKLTPAIGIITNIDQEHMENYENFGHLKDAFVSFANKVPFYGSVICCTDNINVRKILPRIVRKCITYGEKNADYIVKSIKQQGERLLFDVFYKKELLGKIELPMLGDHHAKNALASIALARELDIPFNKIRQALKNFKGVSRRFEILYKNGPIIVDDYAHHPVEIQATILAASKGWPKSKIIAVIQPHRYTRLKSLMVSFISSLKLADLIIVTDVYPAGEKPIKGVTSKVLCQLLRKRYPKKPVAYAVSRDEIFTTMKLWSGSNDIVLFMGAGDITKIAHTFVKGVKR